MEEMECADRLYHTVARTLDVEPEPLKAESARTQEREHQAMKAADIEAECCRECAPAAAISSEETETTARKHPTQGSTHDATAAFFFWHGSHDGRLRI